MVAKRSLLTLLVAVAASILPMAPAMSDDERQAVVPAEMSDAELVAWLRIMWHRWQVDAQYKGDYMFQRASVVIPSGLDITSVDVDNAEYMLGGKGFVAKDGYLYRVSCDFEPKPESRELEPELVPAGAPAGLSTVSDWDFDNATDGEIFVHTYPLLDDNNLPGEFSCVSLGLVDAESLERSMLRRPMLMVDAPPKPTMPVPGEMSFPLEPDHDPADFEVIRLGEDRVRLSTQFERDSGFPARYTYSVEWWLAPEVPIVERSHLLVERTDDEPGGYEIEQRFADFRDCDVLSIPGRVTDLRRGRSVDEDGNPVLTANICQWICGNLGAENPTDKDFAIPIDPVYAVINNVTQPMRFRQSGEISVVELTTDDVLRPGEDAGPGVLPEIPPP